MIFFFDQGVMHATVNQVYWQTFARQQNDTILCCCIDSVERFLGPNYTVSPPFFVKGMGQLAQACDHSDETILI
jgi:hypothetical protein